MSRLEDIKVRLDSQDEMMLTHSDLAVLVAVVEAVQAVRDDVRATAEKYVPGGGTAALSMRVTADHLDAALRPLE